MPASVRRSDGRRASALKCGSKPSARQRYGRSANWSSRERDAEALAHQAVHDALVQALGVGEEALELRAQVVVVEAADRAVQLLVVRVAQLERQVVTAPPLRVEQRVEVLGGGGQARLLDARAARPVRLVALRHARLAQPDGLAVHGDGGLGLGVGDLVAEVLGLLAHEAVDGEGEQVGEAQLLVVDGRGVELLEPVDGLAREQLGIAVVDGRRLAAAPCGRRRPRSTPGRARRRTPRRAGGTVPGRRRSRETPFAGRRRAGRSTRDSTSGRESRHPLPRPMRWTIAKRVDGRVVRADDAASPRGGGSRRRRRRGTLADHATTPRRHDRARRHQPRLRRAGRRARRTSSSSSCAARCPATACAPASPAASSRYAEARTVEILAPSPRRVARRCRHAHECGGCEWQTLAYDAQLEFKQQQVVDSLQRLGAPRPSYVSSRSAAWTTRGATATRWSSRSAPTRTARLVLGLHKRGSWREIVEIVDCELASERMNRAPAAVAHACRELACPSYARDGARRRRAAPPPRRAPGTRQRRPAAQPVRRRAASRRRPSWPRA